MRAAAPLLGLLVLASAFAGCASFPGGEKIQDGARDGDGMPEPVVSQSYEGVLNVSTATGSVTTGDAIGIDLGIGAAYFEGFAAVATWNGTAGAATPPPSLQLTLRKAGTLDAIQRVQGTSPLVLKVEPALVEGIEGPFELYLSVAEGGSSPLQVATQVPYRIEANAYFGDQGADAFARVGP